MNLSQLKKHGGYKQPFELEWSVCVSEFDVSERKRRCA